MIDYGYWFAFWVMIALTFGFAAWSLIEITSILVQLEGISNV